jgi:hypothetical protein
MWQANRYPNVTRITYHPTEGGVFRFCAKPALSRA